MLVGGGFSNSNRQGLTWLPSFFRREHQVENRSSGLGFGFRIAHALGSGCRASTQSMHGLFYKLCQIVSEVRRPDYGAL